MDGCPLTENAVKLPPCGCGVLRLCATVEPVMFALNDAIDELFRIGKLGGLPRTPAVDRGVTSVEQNFAPIFAGPFPIRIPAARWGYGDLVQIVDGEEVVRGYGVVVAAGYHDRIPHSALTRSSAFQSISSRLVRKKCLKVSGI